MTEDCLFTSAHPQLKKFVHNSNIFMYTTGVLKPAYRYRQSRRESFYNSNSSIAIGLFYKTLSLLIFHEEAELTIGRSGLVQWLPGGLAQEVGPSNFCSLFSFKLKY